MITAICFGVVVVVFIATLLWKNIHWSPRGITHRATATAAGTTTPTTPSTPSSGGRGWFSWFEWEHLAWSAGIVILGLVIWRSGVIGVLSSNPDPAVAKAWMREKWLLIPALVAIAYVVADLPGFEKRGKFVRHFVAAIVGILVYILLFAWYVAPSKPHNAATGAYMPAPTTSYQCPPYSEHEVRSCTITQEWSEPIGTENHHLQKGQFSFCRFPDDGLVSERVGANQIRYRSTGDPVLMEYGLATGGCPNNVNELVLAQR